MGKRASRQNVGRTRVCVSKLIFLGRMRFVLAFLSIAALPGCVANNSFVGPSGSQVHSAKCNASPQGCYREASKTCQGSYQVLDSESHAGGLLADILPGPVTWYGMTYSCGPSDGRLPSFAFKRQQYSPSAVPQFRPSAPPVTTNCQQYGNSESCQTY